MKTEASPQGMEVSEQREKMKREKETKKIPGGGRFCNQLIDRWLKNIVWDLVEDPRETISTRNFFLEKIFNQEEVSKGKTMIKKIFPIQTRSCHYSFRRKSPTGMIV